PPPTSVLLTADQTNIYVRTTVKLTATASSTVSGTSYAIDIVDSSGTRLAHCTSGTTCVTHRSSSVAGSGAYAAYIEKSTLRGISTQSSSVTVTWWWRPPPAIQNFTCTDISLNADCISLSNDVTVGDSVMLTATATGSVNDTGGYGIDIWNVNTNTRLARCTTGNQCSATTTSAVQESVAYEACVETADRSSVIGSCVTITLNWFFNGS